MKENVLFCWSSGKDSAFALYQLLTEGKYSVASLLTTVTQDYDRVSMHGVRIQLLEEQSQSLAIPLTKVVITRSASNDDYEKAITVVLQQFKDKGILQVAFGDIFLEDLRKYREDNLAKLGMTALFPIWKRDTTTMAQDFIAAGFKAVITCVDTNVLDKSFAGREFDEVLLADLPAGVDPCGENGEFHSFAYNGPIFKNPILFTRGEVVLRDERFCFCDLVPR
jgi:uncharacterized protein (TIGR00290 family)